jgi:G3E family GTPase
MIPSARITLLTSLDPLLRESVLARLRVDRPDVPVLRHDLDLVADGGPVVRRVTTGTRTTEQTLDLDDGCCLTCLVREDVLTVARSALTEHLVAVVPAALDPLAFAMLLAHAGMHEDALGPLVGFVAVVRSATLEDGLSDTGSPAPLLVEDIETELSVSELLTRQLEHADIVLHDQTDARSEMLIASLADTATHMALDVHPSRWCTPERADSGWSPGGLRARQHMTTITRGGLAHARWHRRRPLHPGRLAEAIDHGLLGRTLRARGFTWVASRPHAVIELSIVATTCALGTIDTWLEPLSDQLEVPDEPLCPAIDLGGHHVEWHPYYGDRFQYLSVICEHDELDAVVDELDRCLLTDAELAEGPEGWRDIDDPLVGSEEHGPEVGP